MSGMSHETLAMLLWLMLGLSIALTIAGVAARASGAVFLAAFLLFVFGILSFLSIGMFILALAMAQLVIGIGIRRQPA
jgi:hypothetical protein